MYWVLAICQTLPGTEDRAVNKTDKDLNSKQETTGSKWRNITQRTHVWSKQHKGMEWLVFGWSCDLGSNSGLHALSSVPSLHGICKLVVLTVWCHQISVSLKASVGAECSAWYQVLGGDQSLAAGSLNQGVKGKKQWGGCLTNTWTTFSFRSVSSMDRLDRGGRQEPSLSSI